MKTHFIKKSNTDYVMFIPQSLKFFNVNENVKSVVEDIESGFSKNAIIDKHKMNEETFDNISKVINADAIKTLQFPEKINRLYKLVIHVTNLCNLDCKYCYADGGSYSSNACVMDIATAKTIVDTFYKRYKSIHMIQFFGGEPLLNEPVINFICQYITELYNEGKIEELPLFGTITNGTIYSEDLVNTIKKYSIQLTLSIDGIKKVHDIMRPAKTGEGSFDIIMSNLEKYRKNDIFPSYVESTYSNTHVQNNESVFDTIKFISDEVGINDMHIVPVSDDNYKLENRDSFVEAVDHVMNANSDKSRQTLKVSMVDRVIRVLKEKVSEKSICKAGTIVFSVSVKGDIYPCFLLTDIDEFKIGNVFDGDNAFNNDKYIKLTGKIRNYNKYEDENCSNCFNARVCSGCIGMNYFNTGDIFRASIEDCYMQKKITEKVLLRLSDMV